jgi:hypothetical protein
MLERVQPRAHGLGVGQPVAQLQWQFGEQELRFVEQLLAALEQRLALPCQSLSSSVCSSGPACCRTALKARGRSGWTSVSRAIRSPSSVSDLLR